MKTKELNNSVKLIKRGKRIGLHGAYICIKPSLRVQFVYAIMELYGITYQSAWRIIRVGIGLERYSTENVRYIKEAFASVGVRWEAEWM